MISEAESRTWDCVVVGAGPAGLNTALVLGRARRRMLVLDNAQPRNYATHAMHGVLGHDGLDPADLRARGRAELGRYGVEVVAAEVQDVEVIDGTVRLRQVRLDNGETLDRDALFFYIGWRLRHDVARTLGCELRDDGSIAVDSDQATTIDRVYAAGNCSDPRALVPAASGSGATAAVAINARLSV